MADQTPTIPPHGCRHCGVEQREHCKRWTEGVGWHCWVEPTRDQVTERVRARRQERAATRAKRESDRG